MKRGTYAVLPVSIDIDMSTVESVKFIFIQGMQKRLMFDYPSNKAYLDEEGNINLIWTKQDTFKFDSGPINMDTLIKLKDIETNPQTKVISFPMSQTLFTMKELGDEE